MHARHGLRYRVGMGRSPEAQTFYKQHSRFVKRMRAEYYLREYRAGRAGFLRTLYRILSLKVRRV